MEINKVRDWLVNKPHFEVTEFNEEYIWAVKRVSDNESFTVYDAVHLKERRISSSCMNIINSFNNDLKTVLVYTYSSQRKCTGHLKVSINDIENATNEEQHRYYDNSENSFEQFLKRKKESNEDIF